MRQRPSTPSTGHTSKAGAEDLAADILGFLADDPDRLGRFLDLTGLTAQTLRQASTGPGFATSLFDYLCADDRLLLAFAADRDMEPAAIEAIRQRLAAAEGGDS